MAKSKTLIVMCGIPGAGKSTEVERYLNMNPNQNVIVVSRDTVRYSMIKEDEPYFAKEKEVFKEYIRLIKEGLKEENAIVVADATHINKTSRAKLLNALKGSLDDVYVYGYVVKAPLEVCLERNALREGRAVVPEESIINMYKAFTNPTLEEGFDNFDIFWNN